MSNVITDNIDVWVSAQKKRKAVGRGSSSKLELYGIKKLRELILELAVQGKLVSQDPNDEPASELLKKVEEEKVQLVKEKKIKKPKKLAIIGKDELPFSLPNNWQYVRLNDIGEWGAGATPTRGNHEYYGGDIPWFKSGELVGDYIDTAEEHVTEIALEKTSLRYNKIGDVLLAMYGATIGKTSILKIAATTNQAVCACTPFTGIYNVFLLTLLKAYKKRFIGMGAGGAQPNISREKIIVTVIALPPFEEQKRIVKKVDELMVLCDQLEQDEINSKVTHQTLVKIVLNALTSVKSSEEFTQNWQQISEHFDTLFTTEESIEELKQTILQLAVMGKLVPQDPNDEPASELLKKIKEEKERLYDEGKIKKQQLKVYISTEEDPFLLPATWEWVNLSSIGIGSTGKTPKTSCSACFDGSIPFLGPGQITPSGDVLDADKTLTDLGAKSSTIATYGDILMVCIGGSIGKSAIVSEKVTFNQQINAISPLINNKFLHIAMKSKFFQESMIMP